MNVLCCLFLDENEGWRLLLGLRSRNKILLLLGRATLSTLSRTLQQFLARRTLEQVLPACTVVVWNAGELDTRPLCSTTEFEWNWLLNVCYIIKNYHTLNHDDAQTTHTSVGWVFENGMGGGPWQVLSNPIKSKLK